MSDWSNNNRTPYSDAAPVGPPALPLASSKSSFLSSNDHAAAATAPAYGTGRVEARNPASRAKTGGNRGGGGDSGQMATLKKFYRCATRNPVECLGIYFDVDTDDVLARVANSIVLCNAPPKPGYVAPVMNISAVPPEPLSPETETNVELQMIAPAAGAGVGMPAIGAAPLPGLEGLDAMRPVQPTHVIDDNDEDEAGGGGDLPKVKIRPGESMKVRGDRYSFVEELRGNPDFYGPFWIGLTLSFIIAVTSNVSLWANLLFPNADDNDAFASPEKFQYDLRRIFNSVTAVYVYSIGTPLMVYSAMSCFGIGLPRANDMSGADRSVSNEIRLPELLCLYGYSLVPWIPAAIFCMIPYDAADWSVLCVAAGCSLMLILRNLVGPLVSGDGANGQTSGLVIGSVIGAQVIFLLVVKLAFYQNDGAVQEK